ncbi:hypothetical protein JCM24511_10041 [Saitozyma sp. JCM 24511]|nr:hypothetical protein JCM24511_10041 [Saitozyma sp. JCM 24511]
MYAPKHVEQFTTLCKCLHELFPRMGYVHMVESGDPAKLHNWAVQAGQTHRSIFEHSSTPFLSAGGHAPVIAREMVKVHGGAVVFGRWFISNPDLCYQRSRECIVLDLLELPY